VHRENADTAGFCGLVPAMEFGYVGARKQTIEGAVDRLLSKEMEFFW
jgi:hypothetical protein